MLKVGERDVKLQMKGNLGSKKLLLISFTPPKKELKGKGHKYPLQYFNVNMSNDGSMIDNCDNH